MASPSPPLAPSADISWDGEAGARWIAAQDVLEKMLAPFVDVLCDALDLRPGMRVLDVGCGTGPTTLAIQRRVTDAGQCVGLDISQPMVAIARERALTEGISAEFIAEDAQSAPLPAQSFDRIASRFGVMFFEDPVSAFANLREAARPGATFVAVTWRTADENPFMTAGKRAALPLLNNKWPREDDPERGPFTFADPARVENILNWAGWTDVRHVAVDRTCSFPADLLPLFVENAGPVASILPLLEEPLRSRVLDAGYEGHGAFRNGDAISLKGACWLLSARNPD